MFEYYLDVWRKYAVFSGRARRAEYWYFFLTNFLVLFVAQMAIGFVSFSNEGGMAAVGMFSVVYMLYNIAAFIPSLAVGVRRLHDSNKSGWWILVPFYNLYLLIRRGTVGENYYGPDPKAPAVDVPPAPPAVDDSTPTA